MNKSKYFLISLILLVLALVILPFLIPIQTYLNQAESIASDKLGTTVTIVDFKLGFLPSPRLVLKGMNVGKDSDLKVSRLVVIPTLRSLFSSNKLITVKINQPVLKKSALGLIAKLTDKPIKPSDISTPNGTSITLEKVVIEDAKLDWPDIKINNLNIEAEFAQHNILTLANVETVDGKLKLELKPKADVSDKNGLHLVGHLTAKDWTLPVGLPLLINQANMDMAIEGSTLSISNIDIALYEGKVTGSTTLNWQKNWQLAGKFIVNNMSVREPASLANYTVKVTGRLFADGQFSSNTKSARDLGAKIQANIQFNVKNGVLYGVDLVKAASLLVKQSNGGETVFDTLSGDLHVAGKQYQFEQLNIRSGLIAASGDVTISPNKSLNGTMTVSLKQSVGLIEMPMNVSGTLNNPSVFPTKAALAGAAIGTALLPGVGTSLGAKAGGALSKFKDMFGK